MQPSVVWIIGHRYCKFFAVSEKYFRMTFRRRLFILLGCGLFFTLPASGASALKVASFSTVLTEIAEQVGGNHGIVPKLLRPRHLHEASLARWKREDRV